MALLLVSAGLLGGGAWQWYLLPAPTPPRGVDGFTVVG
jgi:hypothetical protein